MTASTARAAIAAMIACAFVSSIPASATWKREYGSNPVAVQEWFKKAQVTEEGQKRISFKNCCDQSDRFDTQFRVDKTTAGDAWYFRSEGKWIRIPDDVIHSDEIHALNPEDDKLPEFEAMRRQGVLFIYSGQPTCFWPPEGGI